MRAHGVPEFSDPNAAKPGGPIGMRISNNNGVMTVNGVTLDANSTQFHAAQKTCRGAQGPGPPINAAQRAKMKAPALAYAKCMRAHGVPKFPDPQVSSHGVGFSITPANGIGTGSVTFRAAQKACGGAGGH